MKGSMACVGVTPKTKRWKAYVWGQPDYHIMDWRGCNYRVYAIHDQPRRGFDSADEAVAWYHQRFPTRDDLERYVRGRGDGCYMPDAFFKERQCVDVHLPSGEKKGKGRG